MNLTQQEKGLLRELQMDGRWRSIMEKIQRTPPKRYRPKDEQSFERMAHDWVYYSGRSDENDLIHSILTLSEGSNG